MKRRLTLTLLPLAAAFLLAACSSDCPNCNDLRNQPTTLNYTFSLCVSEVPIFTSPNDPGCGEVSVSYDRGR
jgi:uncharacterized lipoprotein YajG